MTLVEVTNITEDIAKGLNINNGDRLFGCYLDNKIVGYAVIRNNLEERVYLVILDEFQNQGNGSSAFKELLSMINDTVKCSVSIDNYKMQRIIIKNKGIEVGRDVENIHYVIEKK